MQDMTPEQVYLILLRIGRLAVECSRLDLDAFLETAESASSPQAAVHGMSIVAINSAAGWSELSLLLKPFRDRALEMIDAIRAEREGLDDDLVEPGLACPQCGEVRIDELTINDDDSVDCAFCGNHYTLHHQEDPSA